MAKEIEYGIKYLKQNVADNHIILRPVGIMSGYREGNMFVSTENYPIADTFAAINESTYVIDNIYPVTDLCAIYDYDDPDFIKDYYYEDEKDIIVLVSENAGELVKKRVDVRVILGEVPVETYLAQKNDPVVTLNIDSLNALLRLQNINDMRIELQRLRRLVADLPTLESTTGTTKIVVEKGHVAEILNKRDIETPSIPSYQEPIPSSDISLTGLTKYITERVFGHDEEIRIIAKTIIMNYRAKPGDVTEPILLVGPTGTGKTETIKSASAYLNLPFLEVNTANLVPEGIQGTTIEDCLYSLLVTCNNDIELAQKAIIFFDELDKIGESGLDIKNAVKEIMLKFLEGGNFLISKDSLSEKHLFSTHSLNKIYAGAFQSLFDQKLSDLINLKQHPNLIVTPSIPLNILAKN